MGIETDYIWQNGKLIAFDDANTHVLTHTLHYGTGVFEGIRFYQTPNGPAIFKLNEHLDRLAYSAKVIGLDMPFSKEELIQACKDVIIKNNLVSGYIRPLVYFGYGKMGLIPDPKDTKVLVAAWSWGKYLSDNPIRVTISDTRRIHPKTTDVKAKICGVYQNSVLAGQAAKKAGFDEALLLDTDGLVAEGPGENFFLLKNNALFTPKLGTILPGITRATILQLAKDKGMDVVEKDVTPDELVEYDCAFYTGTAAEVTIIKSIDDIQYTDFSKAEMLKELYHDVVTGKAHEYKDWLSYC